MSNAALEEAHIKLPERRSNRPITALHHIEYALAVGLISFFRIIGVDASSALAGGFMGFLGPRLRSISKRAENNLAKAFPDWTEDQIKKTTKQVWVNLGRTAAEFAHLDKFRPFEENGRITVSGEDRLRAIAAGEQPAIFVSGHFANWEIMSIVCYRAGLRYGVVYRAANNPLVDELIINKRAKVMSRHQIPKGKRGGRSLIEAIKAGRSIAMLVDQKLNDGIEAPFMGRPAMTAPAAARLALKFKVPIIPISIERTNGVHFHVAVQAPIQYTPCGNTTKDVLALTTLINEGLEKSIQAQPGQWLWLHRRWPKEQ